MIHGREYRMEMQLAKRGCISVIKAQANAELRQWQNERVCLRVGEGDREEERG